MYKYLTLLLLSITLTSQAQWNPNATSDTEVNGGLMYEASIGGQKFSFTAIK